MIELRLDWREVLWWVQGGMAGSHLRWSVYEDMVNKVWPQCSEQERRNLWYIMRRDLGSYWRPKGWSGYKPPFKGEGEWCPENEIFDTTPWMYFRQVLARFDPDNQWAVTMHVRSSSEWNEAQQRVNDASIIVRPRISHFRSGERWTSDTATVSVRAYKWFLNGEESYFFDWSRRCNPERITEVEQLTIPDNGTM